MKRKALLKAAVVASVIVLAIGSAHAADNKKGTSIGDGIELELKDPKLDPRTPYSNCRAISSTSKICEEYVGDDSIADLGDEKRFLPRK